MYRVAQVYFGAVVAAGLSIALWHGTHIGAVQLTPVFMAFVVLGLAAELTTVPMPSGGRLTASFALMFSSLLLQGLAPTLGVLAVVSVLANVAVQRRPWSLAGFNFAQYALSYWAAGLVLRLSPTPLDSLGVLAGATIAYLTVNIALVNGYIALAKGTALWRVLWEDDRWELMFTVVSAPIAVLMAKLYLQSGWVGAGLVLVPLFVSAGLMVLYLQMRQSRQELAIANQELAVLHQVARRISSQIDLGQTLQLIATELEQVIAHDASMIFLISDDGATLRRQNVSDRLDIPLGSGPIGAVAASGTPCREGSLAAEEAYLSGYPSLLAVPIAADDKGLGVIALLSQTQDAFSPASERLLTILASQAAVAIRNAQLYQATEQLAITDGLTGVYNRRYFQKQLENELRRAPRFGLPISLILIDTDHFKRFNDSHGHLLGDHVLRSIAQILKDSVRETDVVARYGGEEFAVILPETNPEQAFDVAERIRRHVATHTFWGRGQTPVTVTVSIGVASRPAAEVKADQLIELADGALYEAKRTGRDRICTTTGEPDAPFVVRASDPEATLRRRHPSRGKFALDVQAWKAYLLEAPIMAKLVEHLAGQDYPLEHEDAERWQTLIRAGLEALTLDLTTTESGSETGDRPVEHPLYPLVRDGIGQLIQRGMTLTQSESLILALCNTLGQHVQDAPFSPQERLHVLGAVERLTHSLQLAVSQVWHEFYQKTNDHLMTLHQLDQRLGTVHELDALLPEVMALMGEALKAEICLLLLPDREGKTLRIRASWGLPEGELIQWIVPLDSGIAAEVFRQRRAMLVPEAVEHKALEAVATVRSAAYFPLVQAEECLGLMITLSEAPARFTPGDLRLGRAVAGRIGLAIARMHHDDARQGMYLEAIAQLIEVLESKDAHSQGHTENITRYAMAMGQAVGLADGELETLRQAARLHDIGKIAIPESILHKPDRLSPEEREVVEIHPEVGAQILSPIASLKDVVPAVRHHHEHWNGTGYPDGLKGEEIPLLARILAIAEAFDGMTTPKSYRDAYSFAEALDQMRRSHNFDPHLLDAFEGLLFKQKAPSS